jgi:hypothetical protein
MMGFSTEFELGDAVESDLDAIIHILVTAMVQDEVFRYTNADVSYDDKFAFFRAYFGERYALPDTTCFKITEKATG